MHLTWRERLRNLLVAAAHLYLGILIGWAVLRWLLPDRWWWLYILSSMSVTLLLPLPLVLLLGWATRRRELWAGALLLLALGVVMHGGLFLSRPAEVPESTPTLRVMTYNALGYSARPEEVLAVIREVEADVVAFQELNPLVATALQDELADLYPYRLLDAKPGVDGMGLISRYPLTSTEEALPGYWVGTPQVVRMDYEGRAVTLLNLHALPIVAGGPQLQNAILRAREEGLMGVVEYVAAQSDPVLVLGDFNMGDQTRAYALLQPVLDDAWRQAGRGLGHTWPGGTAEEGATLSIVGRRIVPDWWARLDYIFYSAAWQATDAQIGPWDGVSDHRPVVATLALVEEDSYELGTP
jgi:endonuclease/exonuclease/phosphatase (EEP) superfamily protein YafD